MVDLSPARAWRRLFKLLTYSTFIPLHLISYCGTHPTAERYFAFISRNFDPEEGCAAHAFGKLIYDTIIKSNFNDKSAKTQRLKSHQQWKRPSNKDFHHR